MAVLSAFRRWSPLVAYLALAALLNTTLDGPVWAEILRNRPRLVRLDSVPAAPAAGEVSQPAVPLSLPERASPEPEGVAVPEMLSSPEPPSWSPQPVSVLALAQAAQVPAKLVLDASSSAADQVARIAALPPVPSPEGGGVPSDEGRPFEGAAPQETAAMDSQALESSPDRIPLAPGWNLISLPKEPDNIDPAVAFSPISGALEAAHTYDGCNAANPWRVYAPGAPPDVSDLDAVDHRVGVWVQVTGDATLPVAGVEPAETSIQLCQGWNLIGYPLSHPRPVLNALASIAGRFVRVMGYDPTDVEDPWEAFDVGAPTWANDLQTMRPGRGYWVYATEDVSLRMANIGPPPEVSITVPADAATITSPTEIRGTVRSDLLENWMLEYRLKGENAFTTFASGNVPITNAVLGAFDPTLLLNGMFEVRLTVRDFAGRTASASINAIVEGNLKVGNFSLSFVDLDVPVAGLPIQVIRTYDSRDKRKGDFGIGWRVGLSDVRVQETGSLGEAWMGIRRPGPIPSFCIVPTRSHIVTVTFPGGTVSKFRPKVSPECQALFPPQFVTISYVPVTGTRGDLRSLDHGAQAMVIGSFPGPVELWSESKAVLFDPDRYELTAQDGRVFSINQQSGLTSIKDANGNRLTFGPSGIVHSNGKGIVFTRDTLGRITKITDPMSNSLQYTYDANGDLRGFADQEGNLTGYTYNGSHGLLSIEDPRGVKVVRNDYDEKGRLIRHTDAAGKTITLDHRIRDRQEVITDRLGHSRLIEYDERGNIIREQDKNGHFTLRTFDANGNVLTETDPVGNVKTFAYDSSGRRIRETDGLGNSTSYSYDSRDNVSSVTDPAGRTRNYGYDARGNMTTTDDPLLPLVSVTYDARGNLTSQKDAGGAVTTYEYGRDGNVAREIDAMGVERVFTYDANGNRLTETVSRTTPAGQETLVTSLRWDRQGRLIEKVDSDGSVTRMSYDFAGKVTETVDPIGGRTMHVYDDLGRLVKVVYPGGSQEGSSYDSEGRRIRFTDRGGRTTTYDYDPMGRLTRTTYPDGSTTTNGYDAAGRLISVTDARGNTTVYEYDPAGRRTKVIDAFGSETSYVYDRAGNQIAMTDARGHTTRYEYDAGNRLVCTIFSDGASTSVSYDSTGRKVSETDPAGNVTRFNYDAVSRLLAVSDALGQMTRYAYDEVGNRIAQIDANGHATTYEYDPMGRMTRKVLPTGEVETFVYDAAGRMTRHSDFNGDTVLFAYDALGRPLSRIYPDGSRVTMEYTPSGVRSAVTDGRGTTRYTYDLRDRLTRVTYPDSRSISYLYDLEGNRTRTVATIGDVNLSLTYSYDEVNRLKTVTDSAGRIYRYSFDAAGNRASLRHPNGVETTYGYDARNRLVRLETRKISGEMIQSYLYTLDPVGRRSSVQEIGGVVRDYTYDSVSRLTREAVTAAGSLVYSSAFSYDPVGNRLSRQQTAAGAATEVAYTYDERDLQLTENDLSYSWDANGNLLAKRGVTSTEYAWTSDNRLQEITASDGTVTTHIYDADGIRVRTEVREALGGLQITEYLVDPLHALSSRTPPLLSQVLAETNESGDLKAFYVRGDDLLAVIRPSGARFYHADGLGSIRALTDGAGVVTDRYEFSAFGELLRHDGADPGGYLFAGEQLDPNSGFYFLRARWLDPGSGRFASMDPFAGIDSDPGTLHKYLYVGDDPINRTDPMGLFDFWLMYRLLGLAVHDIVGRHFTSVFPMPIRFANYYPIFTILMIPPQACGRVCGLKPDLTDNMTAELYEIKPAGIQSELGLLQLAGYIGIMTLYDPLRRPWHHGITYVPLSPIPLPAFGGWVAIVYPPSMGVISYILYRQRYGQQTQTQSQPAVSTAPQTIATYVATIAALQMLSILSSMITRPRSPVAALAT